MTLSSNFSFIAGLATFDSGFLFYASIIIICIVFKQRENSNFLFGEENHVKWVSGTKKALNTYETQ